MTEISQTRGESVRVGPLEIVPDDGMAWAMGRAVMLTTHEFRLLTALAQRVDRPVSREDLYTFVWGKPMRPGDRSIDVYVRKLRVKLEAALPKWKFIHTHFATGYRLSAERLSGPNASNSSR